jgi:hypothetical protein
LSSFPRKQDERDNALSSSAEPSTQQVAALFSHLPCSTTQTPDKPTAHNGCSAAQISSDFIDPNNWQGCNDYQSSKNEATPVGLDKVGN